MITELISAARVKGEYMQGRDLVQKQWDLSLEFWLDYFIKLRAPLVSVDLFTLPRPRQEGYTTLVEDTDFIVDTKRAQPCCSSIQQHVEGLPRRGRVLRDPHPLHQRLRQWLRVLAGRRANHQGQDEAVD